MDVLDNLSGNQSVGEQNPEEQYSQGRVDRRQDRYGLGSYISMSIPQLVMATCVPCLMSELMVTT